MQNNENQAKVSAFSYEGVVAALDRANKRMLIALTVVCAALVIAVTVFVAGYRANNKDWINYAQYLVQTNAEVADAGVYEQSDTGNHQ